MSYEINKEWLTAAGACGSGTEWFLKQRRKKADSIIGELSKQGKFEWANWALVRFLSHQNLVSYSCYSARNCLVNYEKQVPGDLRVRQAIEAAERWVKEPTEENKLAAWSAAWSAESARSAAWSAESARSAAALAAWSAAASAAWSAESARLAAWSAAAGSAWSARSAAWSAESARNNAWRKNISYGLGLLRKQIKEKIHV